MAKKRGKKRTPPRSSASQRPSASSPKRKAPPRPDAGSAKAGAAAPPRKPTRAERIEAAQRQQRRRRMVRRALVLGVLVFVVGAVTAVVINNRRASARIISRLEAGACQFDRESDDDEGQGRNHVTGSVGYQADPPAGGNHSPSPAAPNVYENPPPDEQVVHSMEHGDVVLWHKPDVGPEVVDGLRAIADRYERDVLVVPRASMRPAVAATAWHRRLLCPGFEREPLDLFVKSYRDKGPEKVPEG